MAPTIWGFALDGALEALEARFTELTKQGRCDWVLVPVAGAKFTRLRVPIGFVLEVGE